MTAPNCQWKKGLANSNRKGYLWKVQSRDILVMVRELPFFVIPRK